MDLNVSTPMMPMTRPLSRRAASMATGPPMECPTRMSCLLGTADSAVATSWPNRAMRPVGAVAVGAAMAREIHGDQRVFLA